MPIASFTPVAENTPFSDEDDNFSENVETVGDALNELALKESSGGIGEVSGGRPDSIYLDIECIDGGKPNSSFLGE